MKFFRSRKIDGDNSSAAALSDNNEHVDTLVADEHTRLLPNRLDSDSRYLSPDDPAVCTQIFFFPFISIAILQRKTHTSLNFSHS